MSTIEWHDVIRALAFFVNLYSVYVLLRVFKHENNRWGEKAKDLWYAMLMWSIGGAVFAAQGIVLDRPLTPAFVFLLAATFVTGKVMHHRGTSDVNASHIL